MSALTYNYLLRQIALRASAFAAPLPATIETAYATLPLTDPLFNSADFPITSIRDALRDAEETIANAAARTLKSSLRAFLLSSTANLANKASIPSVDASGVPIIGIWSGVYDYSNGTECLWATVDEITRANRLAGIVPAYNFNADTDGILHTRTNVRIKCCVYDAGVQAAAIAANGNILLPSVPEEVYISGALGLLTRDEVFASQAVVYRTYFGDAIGRIESGQGLARAA